MGKGNVRIGSIVIDVKDFDRMRTFWQDALGYRPGRPPTPGDPFVILKDPAGTGLSVSIDGMEPYRNRLHLDLYTDDPEGEVERLLHLGATVFRPREPDEDFVVLEDELAVPTAEIQWIYLEIHDPEGNLFCIVDTRES